MSGLQHNLVVKRPSKFPTHLWSNITTVMMSVACIFTLIFLPLKQALKLIVEKVIAIKPIFFATNCLVSYLLSWVIWVLPVQRHVLWSFPHGEIVGHGGKRGVETMDLHVKWAAAISEIGVLHYTASHTYKRKSF